MHPEQKLKAEYLGVSRFSSEWDHKYDLLTAGKVYAVEGFVNGETFFMVYDDTGSVSWVKTKFFKITGRVAPALEGELCEEKKSGLEKRRDSSGST